MKQILIVLLCMISLMSYGQLKIGLSLEQSTLVYSTTWHSSTTTSRNWGNQYGSGTKYSTSSLMYTMWDIKTVTVPVFITTIGGDRYNFRIFVGNKIGIGIGQGYKYFFSTIDLGYSPIYNSFFVGFGMKGEFPINKHDKIRIVICSSWQYMFKVSSNSYAYYNVSKSQNNNTNNFNVFTNYINEPTSAMVINILEIGIKININNKQ